MNPSIAASLTSPPPIPEQFSEIIAARSKIRNPVIDPTIAWTKKVDVKMGSWTDDALRSGATIEIGIK